MEMHSGEPKRLLNSADYDYALLWLMGQTGQGKAESILQEFERRFGELIPEKHWVGLKSGEPVWRNNARWGRKHLVEAGLMGSGGHGVWTITEAGREWLRSHPNRTGSLPKVDVAVQRSARTASPRSARSKGAEVERAKEIVVQEIASIRAYLNGNRDAAPSDERLCDWVQFCYTLELFTEAAALFKLIRPDAVNPWLFERTSKLARACALRQR